MHVECIYLGSFTGQRMHDNYGSMEADREAAEYETLCCSYKLQEARNRKQELTEEDDLESLEKGCGDVRKERFQVSIFTSECEPTKLRKSDVLRDRGLG